MEVRKIVSKEAGEKRRKRNQIIIGIVLVGLMVMSSAGYSFMSQDDSITSGQNKVTHNGFEFISNGGLWQLTLGNLNFYFTNTPNDVTPINSSLNLMSSYSGKVLYVSSQNTEAELEIYRNLDQIVFRRQYACLEGENCTNPQYPIKTCEDYFIIIRESEINSITQDRNCVYIEGKKENLAKVADEFLFKILNIR